MIQHMVQLFKLLWYRWLGMKLHHKTPPAFFSLTDKAPKTPGWRRSLLHALHPVITSIELFQTWMKEQQPIDYAQAACVPGLKPSPGEARPPKLSVPNRVQYTKHSGKSKLQRTLGSLLITKLDSGTHKSPPQH